MMSKKFSRLLGGLAASVAATVLHFSMVAELQAQVLPSSSGGARADIRNTRHNLSTTPPSRASTSFSSGDVVTANTQTEICVYCHTPHAAQTIDAPLWNRALPTQTYTPYTSSSLQADIDVSTLGIPSSSLNVPSKLCLSCHDGTLALGTVSNAPGSGAGSQISMKNTAAGAAASTSPTATMPTGKGEHTGFTRKLGIDLRNDHPIAFTYDTTLAQADGELRNPAGSTSPTLIANRASGVTPNFPLAGGQVQCSTCHDPHRNTQKFLLKNRLAQVSPSQLTWTGWAFDDAKDQICLGCHTRLGQAWAQSAHANSTTADKAYKDADAANRDFPTGTKVWQAGCLNCHDTHTVAGSRRLLREGVGPSGSLASGSVRTGYGDASDYATNSATENTCYQCHSNNPIIDSTALSSASDGVPNIEGEFARSYKMPITNEQQSGNSYEVHDILNADAQESQTNLGSGVPENRHVECSDCHNPHRVLKGNTFIGQQPAGTATRTHTPALNGPLNRGEYGNIASGALRGAWGIEPSYTAVGQNTVTSSSIWMSAAERPTYSVKKGDPGGASSLPVGNAGTNAVSYLTREYQLCFKCHSDHANGPNATDFTLLGRTGGSTVGACAGQADDCPNNRMTRYTNVAAEFAVLATDPPTTGTHQGEAGITTGTTCSGGDCTPVGSSWDTRTTNASTLNHRSWHPVVFPTGRDKAERGSAASFDNLRPPFNTAAKIGMQTMHCSDCHGHSGSWEDGVGPYANQVQGPHGSDSPFLLKGGWMRSVNLGAGTAWTSSICNNCHITPSANFSGFGGDHVPDGNMSTNVCMSCHIAVPHGWKNKAFLANLNCVGTEGGEAGNCVNRTSWANGLTVGPYYNLAYLSVSIWRRSGNWTTADAANGDDVMGNCGGGSMDGCADGD